MKLYYASISSQTQIGLLPCVGNILESYLYLKNKDLPKWLCDKRLTRQSLFLDSGAFSAFTLGVTINLDKYINFLHRNIKHLNVYATLDVIGDWQATKQNTEYMESCGLKPLATFHYGSPLEELQRMVEKYEYIALGGLVPICTKRNLMKEWLDKCFKVIVNVKPITKVHGFGVNSFWAWERYPFYSVDATSWLSGSRFGKLITFEKGKIKSITPRNKEMSLEKYKILTKTNQIINLHNVIEYAKCADYVTRQWEAKSVKWD